MLERQVGHDGRRTGPVVLRAYLQRAIGRRDEQPPVARPVGPVHAAELGVTDAVGDLRGVAAVAEGAVAALHLEDVVTTGPRLVHAQLVSAMQVPEVVLGARCRS